MIIYSKIYVQLKWFHSCFTKPKVFIEFLIDMYYKGIFMDKKGKKLPTKTKIAAWWMTILGIIGLIFSVFLIFMLIKETYDNAQIIIIFLLMFIFPPSLLIFFSGLVLFAKKRWAWWLSVVMIAILMIGLLAYFFVTEGWFPDFWVIWNLLVLVPLVLLILPLVLLLLDRKNFWKVIEKGRKK